LYHETANSGVQETFLKGSITTHIVLHRPTIMQLAADVCARCRNQGAWINAGPERGHKHPSQQEYKTGKAWPRYLKTEHAMHCNIMHSPHLAAGAKQGEGHLSLRKNWRTFFDLFCASQKL
jgi:hypothetical protein